MKIGEIKKAVDRDRDADLDTPLRWLADCVSTHIVAVDMMFDDRPGTKEYADRVIDVRLSVDLLRTIVDVSDIERRRIDRAMQRLFASVEVDDEDTDWQEAVLAKIAKHEQRKKHWWYRAWMRVTGRGPR